MVLFYSLASGLPNPKFSTVDASRFSNELAVLIDAVSGVSVKMKDVVSILAFTVFQTATFFPKLGNFYNLCT